MSFDIDQDEAEQCYRERAAALAEVERLREATRWRPISELTPTDATILIVDDQGFVDLAVWRASHCELIKQWRGIKVKALWWMPLPDVPKP